MEIRIELKEQAYSSADFTILTFAKEELARYLTMMLETVSTDDILQIRLELKEGLRYDGYCIEQEKNIISIWSAYARGILHGVYELLRQFGCNFLFPGKERQIIPKLKEFPVLMQNVKKEPYLEYRGMCFYDTTKETLSQTSDAIDWMCKNGYNFLLTSIHRLDDTEQGDHAILWDEIKEDINPEVIKRGIVVDLSEHSTDYYFPKEELYEEHPEWFSLLQGVRYPGQICYSNQEAVKAYAESIVNFVKERDDLEFFGIWPLDGGGYCECENCKDPLTVYRANQFIAKEISKVRPDLTVEHLAYTPQSFARPTDSMEKNMSVLVCSERGRVAYEWGRKAKEAGGAFYFDYMTADHYRYRSFVKLNPHFIKDTINTMVAYEYRGIVSLYLPVTCWWQASLNYWYMAKLYYDPTADLSDLTKELSGLLFGSDHQEKMAEILGMIYDKLQDPALWSSYVHGHEWYGEHICNRYQVLDQLHEKKMYENYCIIIEALSKESCKISSSFGKKHATLLKTYLDLQWLYYIGVDLFDATRDTKERAEPYFKKLGELSLEEDNPFILEKYARWRITGRDNLFAPNMENSYEARS